MGSTDLNLSDYNFVKVEDVQFLKLEQPLEFYDVEVEDDHTLHIKFGDEYILSHNCDGAHIVGLILNMIQQFWPTLLEQGFVYRLVTPLIVATYNKKEYEFFSEASYLSWEHYSKPHKYKYNKGLGGFISKDFARFIQNEDEYLIPMSYNDIEDFNSIDLAFDKSRADERKEWLVEMGE